MIHRGKIYIVVLIIIMAGIFYLLSASGIAKRSSVPTGKEKTAQNNPDPAGKEQLHKKKVIGISVMNYINEYWIDFINGAKACSKDADYEVISVDEHDSADAQVQTLKKFINQGVDGIVVAPINETALEPVIHSAIQKGIKIITHHDLKEFNVFCGPNEYDIGFMAGRHMGKLLKEAGIEAPKLAMLVYPELGTLIDREKGLEDGLREFVPEATIVVKQKAPDPILGEKAGREILKEHPDINGFVGINDNGLLGALKVANELGVSDRKDFMIVGIGGDTSAVQLIKDNTPFKATVYIDPWLNGYNDVKYLKDMFEGKDYYNKVVYFSPLSIIDSSNVNSILAEKERRKKLTER